MWKRKKRDKNGLTELWAEIKNYLSLQGEYLKINLVEKLTRLASAFLLILSLMLLVFSTSLFLLFAVAYALSAYIGLSYSFLTVAGVYLLAVILLTLFRERLIVNPILRFVIKTVYKNDKKTIIDSRTTSAQTA